MKRASVLTVGVVFVAMSCAGVATARPLLARSAASATVELRETSLGSILVDSTGLTLFEFTKDGEQKDACVKIKGCAAVWPLLQVSGTPTAGVGVSASLLGTINLGYGVSQVSYAGHALFLYVNDSTPGQVSYVGAREFGGRWYAVNAEGKSVK